MGMALSTELPLGALLAPFSIREIAAASGLSAKDIGRWRTGARVPSSGPNVRGLAKALMALRAEQGLPCGDYAETIAEVWAATRKANP